MEDDFAGTCHGVIKRIAPEAEVIHITHGIAPHDVRAGAVVLADTLPYMPVGIHVAVVDPGVGGERRALALRGEDGRVYTGPDNGLLLLAAERLGGVAEAVEIASPEYLLHPVSATFHGRDVFAPAAAHLARGVPLAELGRPLRAQELERIDVPRPAFEEDVVRASVLALDRFGNLQLNASRADVERFGIAGNALVELPGGRERHTVPLGRTFSDVAEGEAVLYEDAYGHLTLAVNRGSAARRFALARGDELRLSPSGP